VGSESIPIIWIEIFADCFADEGRALDEAEAGEELECGAIFFEEEE